MRKGLAVVAVCLGVVSILLTARYGWKSADEEIDKWIAAVMLGGISLCAFIFDAVAVRLWTKQWYRVSIFIGAIAGLAFVVTFSNSLGGIVGRSDVLTADRAKAIEQRDTNKATLARLEKDLAAIGAYTPTTQAAVTVAERAAARATERRLSECGENDEKMNLRGNSCKARQTEEGQAVKDLAAAIASKATTDRAAELETEIKAVKVALDKAKPVASADPLGAALHLMLGGTPQFMTATVQAIMALVFDLCLVGLMVAHEALGHPTPAVRKPEEEPKAEAPKAEVILPEPDDAPVRIAQPPRPRLVATRKTAPATPVARIMTAALEPRKGASVDLTECYQRYVEVCVSEGVEKLSPDEFLDAMVGFCKSVGIKPKVADSGVALMNVQLIKQAQAS